MGRVIDGAPVAVLVASAEMRYVAVNESACDLLGYTRPELLELSVLDLAMAPAADRMYADLIRDGRQSGVTPLRHKSGDTIIVRYDAYETDAGGEKLYVALVHRRRTIPTGVSPQAAATRGGAPSDPTPRELDILELLAEGLDNDEIAARLYVSRETVKMNVRRLLQKLGARSRTHVVALAFRRGLIS